MRKWFPSCPARPPGESAVCRKGCLPASLGGLPEAIPRWYGTPFRTTTTVTPAICSSAQSVCSALAPFFEHNIAWKLRIASPVFRRLLSGIDPSSHRQALIEREQIAWWHHLRRATQLTLHSP